MGAMLATTEAPTTRSRPAGTKMAGAALVGGGAARQAQQPACNGAPRQGVVLPPVDRGGGVPSNSPAAPACDDTLRAWWWVAQRAEVATNIIRGIPTVALDEPPARAVTITLGRLADHLSTMPVPPPGDVAIPLPVIRELCRRFHRAQALLRDIPRTTIEQAVAEACRTIQHGDAGPDLAPLWAMAEPLRPLSDGGEQHEGDDDAPRQRRAVAPRQRRAVAPERKVASTVQRRLAADVLRELGVPVVPGSHSVNSKLNRVLRGAGFWRVSATTDSTLFERDDGVAVLARHGARWELALGGGQTSHGKGAWELAEALAQ